MQITGSGAVLPAGTPTATVPAGDYEVTIDGTDESGMLRCIYPGGFVKHHQAGSVEELATKVTSVLRNRYGATDVQFASAPKSLKEKQSFVVKGS
jgi:hypothetical protein